MRTILIILGVLTLASGGGVGYWWFFGKSRTEVTTTDGRKFAITREGREWTLWLVYAYGDELELGVFDERSEAEDRLAREIEGPDGGTIGGAGGAGIGAVDTVANPLAQTANGAPASQFAVFEAVMNGG